MNKIIHDIGHTILIPFRTLQICALRLEGKRNREKFKGRENKVIVFIANYPQGWNSFKPVYDTLKKDKTKKIVLVGYVSERYPSSTESFWKKIDPDAIIAKEGQVPSIAALSADLIFRQTPYDDEFPEEYTARKLSKIAKLCYIPYGYQLPNKIHLDSEYNDWFFPFLTAIYACSDVSYQYCMEKKKLHKTTEDIRVFNYGYPRFELLSEVESSGSVSRFLWIPRWSTDEVKNDGSGFFKYSDLLLDYFSKHQELSLWIRPHPLMFGNFIRKNLMSEAEVQEYRRKIEELPNIFLDEGADYIETFSKVDAMIADFSGLVVEFFVSGKPIIYCGDKGKINHDALRIVTLCYNAEDWNSLQSHIEELSRGYDPEKEERRKYCKELFHRGEHSIAKKIADSCTNEI